MSTASLSVPSTSPSQYGASSVQHAQASATHGGTAPMHGHASSGMAPASDTHVNHASGAGLYPESVQQTPHHLAAGSFPGAQLSPMAASPYGAYAAAQHPMYGGSYSGHAYPPYPNYMGHMSHYGHPPHYPGASTTPAYHNQVMNSMVPHNGYSPHAAGHMASHHAQAGTPLSMAGSAGGAGLPAGPGGPMAPSAVVQAPSYGATPQYSTQLPLAGRHRVTTTLWEDEGTLCFQVDVKGVCVARRHDNNMVNGTKLLNVCGMSRGKRDGILKNEKERIVVKVGAMHLKGVWIAFNRGKQLAEQHGIADALYPLFEPNIQSFLYHPDNYPRTAAVMAAAQERHVQRHYPGPSPGGASMKEVGGGEIGAGMPLHAGLDSSHWGNAQQQSHEQVAAGNDSLHYQQYQQHYPHHQHHSAMVPPPTAGPGMFASANGHYSQGMPQPMRSTPTSSMGMDRRVDHGADTSAGQPGTPTNMHPGANGTHRRISGMKRPNDDYSQSPSEASHQDSEQNSQQTAGTPSGGGHAAMTNASGHGPSDSFPSGGFGAQNFALDDMKMMKRPKISEPMPSSQGHSNVQPVYSGDHAPESDARTQSHAEVR